MSRKHAEQLFKLCKLKINEVKKRGGELDADEMRDEVKSLLSRYMRGLDSIGRAFRIIIAEKRAEVRCLLVNKDGSNNLSIEDIEDINTIRHAWGNLVQAHFADMAKTDPEKTDQGLHQLITLDDAAKKREEELMGQQDEQADTSTTKKPDEWSNASTTEEPQTNTESTKNPLKKFLVVMASALRFIVK